MDTPMDTATKAVRPRHTRIGLRYLLGSWRKRAKGRGKPRNGWETRGVKVLFREGFIDSFAVIVEQVSWFNAFGCSGMGRRKGAASLGSCGVLGVGPVSWGVIVSVRELITGSVVDFVGIIAWFDALGCSRTGGGAWGHPNKLLGHFGGGEGMCSAIGYRSSMRSLSWGVAQHR